MSDMRRRTLLNIRRQLRTDEPDVGGRGVEAGEDEVETKASRDRLMRAIRLGEASSPKDYVRTHVVEGADADERSSRKVGFGPRSASTENKHVKTSPTSYSEEESYSTVKVAAKQANERRKLRAVKADKESIVRYRDAIMAPPIMLDVPIDELPMLPYPENDSPEIIQELDTIIEMQETAPLTDEVMDLSDEEPIELFVRACHAVGVPADNDTAAMLIQDLRRIALTLKYTHMRARPASIAPYHNRTVVVTDYDPYDDTPSYPSVHATIGYGLANMYATMYPDYADTFYQVGDTIALQRIQSGRHYPSDNQYAKILADLLLR
jgi:acid phosphatase (class A)